MKNSIDNTKDVIPIRHEQCSEKTCATCFENRGCIYEQYPVAAIHTIEESYLQSTIDTNSPISKRA
jgi:hypothetical protein